MKIKTLLAPALLLVLLAAASPARAQNRSESWEFGPYLAGFSFDDAIEIEDDTGGGFRVGYNFVPMHEMEFSFEGVDTQDDVYHQIDVTVTQFQANYVFNFVYHPRQKVVPYITAGLGGIRIEVSDSFYGTDNETDPLFSLGGGVRFFFTKQFNLRLDLRSISFTGDNVVLADQDFTNSEFSVGVGWVVGGR
jgi:opacity protein-like surface antigen